MGNTLVSLPLCALKRSKLNVRKTEPAVALSELAASIASKGLLENLIVRPASKDEGIYDVIAGARRLQALKLLAKRKTIAPDYPVSCLILESGESSDLIEISLAENTVRAPLHPADQFEAFAKLQTEGLSNEDIAARFGLSATVVRQRLKLASVSPRLIAEYRKGVINLDQVMAFAISDDHAAQEEVWSQISRNDSSPQTIKRLLTRSLVEGSDRRALFIGAKAYEKAGGTILRDLFAEEDEGYFTDSQLLGHLVCEKLESEARKLRQEGWSWVDVRPEKTYVDLTAYSRVRMIEVALPEKDEARLRVLSERYDELVALLDDEENEALEKEFDGLSRELEALQDRKAAWPEEGKNTAGAVITLDYTGCPQIVRGLVRPGDKRKIEKSALESSAEGSKPNSSNGYAESLVLDLSAHRTAALQESLARRPDVALVSLLHVLVLHLFFDEYGDDCIAIMPRTVALEALSPSVGQSKAMLALSERTAKWRERLSDRDTLWAQIEALSRHDKLELLAYCTAVTLDATQRHGGGATNPARSEQLAVALTMDMAEWWQPTRDGFFNRLTKAQMMEAVSEACSPDIATRLDGLKKPEMTAKAEALVSGTRWLPESLRIPTSNADIVNRSPNHIDE